MTSQMNLDVFAVLWNQMQNQKTSAVHLRILTWLQNAYDNQDNRLLLMAFRSCGKSTLIGIYCAWVIYQNPNIRIIVMAADDVLAQKMVRNIRRILERHPLTKMLMPTKSDQWANDRFTVSRNMELRDPTVIARGLTSNVTGARSDIIIYDDVEVPNTSSTKEAREELRHRLDETRFLLTPGGVQLYVGTPHCYDTIYATNDMMQNADQGRAYLDNFYNFRLPIYDDNEQSVWPERFPNHDIESLKKQVGPNKFESQMMLRPTNISQGRLNPDLLQFYDMNLDYKEVSRRPLLYLGGRQIISCCAWWDPSFGGDKSDGSVLAIIFTDEEGRYYLHHISYIRVTSLSDDDEATQQCKKIAALLSEFYIPHVTVETNGIGKFLPAILRREIKKSGHFCAVSEHHTTRQKSQKILEGFDAVMANENLHVHNTVKQTSFLNEMREWRPGSSTINDDGLDAVASALIQEPIRIAGVQQTGVRKNWSPAAQIFRAKT